ncbi:MAG: aminotransferase class I/II-fold pyridoxal phosphate-dependent enzyme [Crocinitomicaceae bacterium]|nr:aminotransferase class I/II-fold pyridoxal phosphate-dependent enzyme [Crocinitomicaceae bacterium]
MKSPKSILEKLNQRKADHAFRELMVQGNKVDFFSNDYLGVAKLPFEGQMSYGSTGSRLISGNSKYTERLENYLANFFQHESGLLFNSGYDANLAIYSCIPQKGDTVLYDEYAHASIRDGIRLSLAKSFSFRHNDLEHLKERLKVAEGTVYVAVESIYSMDGDEAPLELLAEFCKANNLYLIVDEAHSGGLYGDGGNGLVAEKCLDLDIFCKLITFGKAYGSHGAIVLSSKEVRDYLVNFARPFIYSTALSFHSQERIEFVVNKVALMDLERKKLKENISFFKSEIQTKKVKCIESSSPVQSIVIPGNEEARSIAARIQEAGFAVKAILSPTVPKGHERIRICLHSYNSHEEIKALIECLN